MKKIFDTTKIFLICILALGFVLRVGGISYGLPLWLVGDEPPFTLTALKMIELSTLLPVLHQADFSKVLYFSPYLSYIYLPAFTAILFSKLILFGGTIQGFADYLLNDLSAFFIAARLISVLFGTATIYLVYRIAKHIFENERTALISAAFLSFSVSHVLLSHWGRDWIPATFFFALSIYFLTDPKREESRRHLLSSITGGIAFGVSIIAAFIPIFLTLWETMRVGLKTLVRTKTVYLSALIFALLTACSLAIYPYGFFLTKAHSAGEAKSITGLLHAYSSLLKPIVVSDPFLFIWVGIGLVCSFMFYRKFFLTAFLFINIYILIFYFSFHTGDRFMIYLFPLFALLAGYGLSTILEKLNRNSIMLGFGILTMIVMLAHSIRLDYVLLKNDTRTQARQWIEKNLREGSKIIVLAPLTRLSVTPEAVEEQGAIGSHSLRQIDLSEARSPKTTIPHRQFHALNLYAIDANAEDFYRRIGAYRKENGYQYALVSTEEFPGDADKNYAQKMLIESGTTIMRFPGSGIFSFDLTEGSIGSMKDLWTMENNGPEIVIIRY